MPNPKLDEHLKKLEAANKDLEKATERYRVYNDEKAKEASVGKPSVPPPRAPRCRKFHHGLRCTLVLGHEGLCHVNR